MKISKERLNEKILFQTEVDLKQKNDIDMRGFKIKSVGSPLNDGDVASKGYVDTATPLL